MQTVMPAIEDLLPTADEQPVQDMLFELAVWHALAKLRLHTDVTLEIFRASTQHMYEAVRTFATVVCPRHETRESPRQAQARVRRQQAKNPNAQPDSHRKDVKYNVVNTYKYHSLGDYADYIVRHGTSDNWTTQIVSLSPSHSSADQSLNCRLLGRAGTSARQTILCPQQPHSIRDADCAEAAQTCSPPGHSQ